MVLGMSKSWATGTDTVMHQADAQSTDLQDRL